MGILLHRSPGDVMSSAKKDLLNDIDKSKLKCRSQVFSHKPWLIKVRGKDLKQNENNCPLIIYRKLMEKTVYEI